MKKLSFLVLYAQNSTNPEHSKQIDLTPTWLTVYPIEVWQQPLAGPRIFPRAGVYLNNKISKRLRVYCVREIKGFSPKI